MTNPYAPPQAAVLDVLAPTGAVEQAERLTRLGAAILDGIIFGVMACAKRLAGRSRALEIPTARAKAGGPPGDRTRDTLI